MDVMRDINIHLENKKESRHFFWFLWIMYSFVYMTKNCFSAALAPIVAEGILTKSQTGLIVAAFYIAYTPLQIVGGIAADRYSPEKLILTGLIGGAASNLVIFLNQNYYVMLVAWVFNAIIQFGLWPSVFKIYSSQLCRSDRPIMVFYMSFSSIGGLLLGYLAAGILPNWRYNFILSSAVLVILAVILYIFCKHLSRFMKRDYTSADDPSKLDVQPLKLSTSKLFWISGFFIMLPVVAIRQIVANSIQTLAPTMLMESYESVSPLVGNLLNTFVITAGIIGTIIIKKIYYPRFVKNELVAYLPIAFLALPFLIMIKFIGKVNIISVIISMCLISALLTAVLLLQSHYTMRYSRFGKNGTAAGITNAAASLGLVIQNYGLLKVADNFGWQSVINIMIVMVVLLPVFLFLGFMLWRRFSKKVKNGSYN